LVDIHGGPASYVLFDHEAQAYWPVLWSQGWAILALNAVGSASFGRRFSDRLNGRWGELDLPQHIAAVQQLQEEGVADDRLMAIGKSYGGYLTAWAIGHTSIFKAAVVLAPVANIGAHWGTSDSGYYSDPYSMAGDRSDTYDTMRRLSPVHYADKITTPALLLQGEKDERCPKSQIEELFVALKRGKSKSSELVIYPGESHKFTAQAKPSYRTDIVQRIADWAARWVASDSEDDVAEAAVYRQDA